MGHAPLVCESDSEAPPIARTAHAVHCACATCARVTRVGWSAVSQSRAVVESATGSGNHQHTGPSSTRAWLGCRTSVVQHKQHNVWAWWGSGAAPPLDEGGGVCGGGHCNDTETKEKTFVSAFHLVAQDPRARPPATMVHGSPASWPLPALTKTQVEHAWCLPRVGLVKPVTRGKRAWEQPPQPVATAERSHFFVNCQPNKGRPVAPPPRSARPRPRVPPRTPLCKYKLGPAVRGARGTRWR